MQGVAERGITPDLAQKTHLSVILNIGLPINGRKTEENCSCDLLIKVGSKKLLGRYLRNPYNQRESKTRQRVGKGLIDK